MLTAARGVQRGERASTGTPITWIGSLGPSVYSPLLDFGALDAHIEVADLQSQQVLAATSRRSWRRSAKSTTPSPPMGAAGTPARLDRALAAARQATQLASERYDRGLTDFLNVLDAERRNSISKSAMSRPTDGRGRLRRSL